MISGFTKERQSYVIDNRCRKTRVAATYSSKVRSYLTFPAFSLSPTWRGASEIVLKFNFSLDSATSILRLFTPTGANYCACVSWKPTTETIVRYKLWSDVGEILWVPLYSGEKILGDFSIEIWNTPETEISGGGFSLELSTLLLPRDYCDSAARELGVDFRTCTDLIFDLTNFAPDDGDYYIVVGDCGVTELVKRSTFADYWLLQSTDGTWHYLELVRFDGVTYSSLRLADVAGDTPYLPLIDKVSGLPFEVAAQGYDGGYGYAVSVNSLATNAYGVVYLKADDGKYYGVRLAVGWTDWAFTAQADSVTSLLVDQEETIQ